MVNARFSPEAQLESALADMACSAASFVKIAQQSGVSVNATTVSYAMLGKKCFERELANLLLGILAQMKSLQRAIDLAEGVELQIAWGSTEKVVRALAYRRLQAVATEFGDSRMDDFAKSATKDVAQARQ